MRKFTLIFTLLVAMVTTAMAQIDLVDGAVYKIMNLQYTANCILDNGVDNAQVGAFNATQKGHMWVVIDNGNGSYSLKNLSTQKFLMGYAQIGIGSWIIAATKPELYIYKVADGQYYISVTELSNPNAKSRTCAHHPGDHNNLVTWDNVEDNGTQFAPSTWNFVKVYDSEEAANALDKSLLVGKLNEANALMSESGFNVTIGEAVALSVGEGGNLTTNYPAIDSDILANCIDTDPNTLFHSNWQAGTTSGHYLQVDLGEGNELEAFQLNYLTRQSGNNAAPYSAIVYGSNNGEDFVPLAELSKDDKINPLPDTNGPSYSTMVFGLNVKF